MLAPLGRRIIAMIWSILPGLRLLLVFGAAAPSEFFGDRLVAGAECAAVFLCAFAAGLEGFVLLIRTPSVATARRCHHHKPRTGASPRGKSRPAIFPTGTTATLCS